MSDEHMTKEQAVLEIRKECRQFAMLYYHYCKTLIETLGEEAALELARKAIFSLSRDRSLRLREKAEKLGLPLTPESFANISDLPACAWTNEYGGLACPYAETWLSYYNDSPWFPKFASLYCDVIDTTNIEVFSGELSHKITKNLLWGDDCCEREYFPSDAVKDGRLTYE